MKKKCGRCVLRAGTALLFALLFALSAAATTDTPATDTPETQAVSTAAEFAQQYEAGGEIAVKGKLVLDQEMTLGGTQPTTILLEQGGCLVIQAAVTVDNPNLTLRGGRGGIIFLLHEGGTLTQKQGTAEVESGGIVLRQDGTLQTGSETNFLMSLTGEWANGVADILCDPLVLEGITINGDGVHNSGVDRRGDLILRRCSINLTGENSASVRLATITELTDTTLVPPYEGTLPSPTPEPSDPALPPDASNPSTPPQQSGTVAAIYHTQGICAAVGAEPALPETFLAGCWAAGENGIQQQLLLPVVWDRDAVGAEPGVYLVQGQFTKEGLEAAGLENPKKLSPSIKVLRYAEGGRMPHLWITRKDGRLRLLMYRPFGAEALWLEYSRDGVNWEREDENYLIPDSDMASISQIDLDCYPISAFDPYPDLPGYEVRVVVEGGIFDGASESYRVGEGATVVPEPTPDPNWSEGDRGGGGRDEPIRQELPAVVQPVPKRSPMPSPQPSPEGDAATKADSGAESAAQTMAVTATPIPETVTPITPGGSSWTAMVVAFGSTAVVCTGVVAISKKRTEKRG